MFGDVMAPTVVPNRMGHVPPLLEYPFHHSYRFPAKGYPYDVCYNASEGLYSFWNYYPPHVYPPSPSVFDVTGPGVSNVPSSHDPVDDLIEQVQELSLEPRKFFKVPPSSYICHLCLYPGHYVQDCYLEDFLGGQVEDPSKVKSHLNRFLDS